MGTLLERLGLRLREWGQTKANQVRHALVKGVYLANNDAPDLMRSRAVEQEVLNLIDEPIQRTP